MPSNDAEKTKAGRVKLILYAVMGIFILIPLVLFWIFR